MISDTLLLPILTLILLQELWLGFFMVLDPLAFLPISMGGGRTGFGVLAWMCRLMLCWTLQQKK